MSRPISEMPLENGDLLIGDREEKLWHTLGMLVYGFWHWHPVLHVFEYLFYKANAHKMCKISL